MVGGASGMVLMVGLGVWAWFGVCGMVCFLCTEMSLVCSTHLFPPPPPPPARPPPHYQQQQQHDDYHTTTHHHTPPHTNTHHCTTLHNMTHHDTDCGHV